LEVQILFHPSKTVLPLHAVITINLSWTDNSILQD